MTPKQIIAQTLGLNESELIDSEPLIGQDNADSLDLIECIHALEDEFSIHLDDDEAHDGITVQGLVDLVARAREMQT